VIVPASPIVPGNEDHRVLPIGERLAVDYVGAGAIANGIDDGSYPGGSGAVGASGMVRLDGGGNDPVHLIQLAIANVLSTSAGLGSTNPLDAPLVQYGPVHLWPATAQIA